MDTEKELQDLIACIKAEIKGIREVVKQSGVDARNARKAAENVPNSLYGKLVTYEDLVEKASMFDALQLIREDAGAVEKAMKELSGDEEQKRLASYLIEKVELGIEKLMNIVDS